MSSPFMSEDQILMQKKVIIIVGIHLKYVLIHVRILIVVTVQHIVALHHFVDLHHIMESIIVQNGAIYALHHHLVQVVLILVMNILIVKVR